MPLASDLTSHDILVLFLNQGRVVSRCNEEQVQTTERGMSLGHRTVIAVCQRYGIRPVKVSAHDSIDNATIVFGSSAR